MSKKINSRGMAQANKHTIMAALSYNLKKVSEFPNQASQNRGEYASESSKSAPKQPNYRLKSAYVRYIDPQKF